MSNLPVALTPFEVASSAINGKNIVDQIRAANSDNERRLRFKTAVTFVYQKYGRERAIETARNLSPVPLDNIFIMGEIHRHIVNLAREREMS